MDYNVSVIVPCYNMGPFLRIAIESILNQSYPPKEIIVINDGSSDDTENVAKSFASKIKYISHKQNFGVSFSRNEGILIAKGDWIAFLDADDFWHTEKLEKQIKVLRDNPYIGFVHSSAQYYHEKNKRTGKIIDRSPVQGSETLKALFNGITINTCTVLAKKDLLLKAGGFYQPLKYSEDYDLWIRLSSLTEFGYVNKVLTFYRQHPSQATSIKNIRKKHLGHISVLFRNKNIFISELDITEKQFFETVAYRLALFAIDAWNKKSYFLCFQHILHAMKYHFNAGFLPIEFILRQKLLKKPVQ